MMPDLLEDLAAFVFATQPTQKNVFPVCGDDLEENDESELCCPQCDN